MHRATETLVTLQHTIGSAINIMRVVILANGTPPSASLLRQRVQAAQLFIATDGAANTALNLGVSPQIICGDFDSLPLNLASIHFPHAEIVVAANQDYADLEKALRLAKERGATEVNVLGASGGRIDHTLANFALLLHWSQEFSLSMETEDTQVWGLTASTGTQFHQITAPIGSTLSVIAAEPSLLSLQGTLWEVENLPIFPGTRGVSNKTTQEKVVIEVKKGSLFVCLTQTGNQPLA